MEINITPIEDTLVVGTATVGAELLDQDQLRDKALLSSVLGAVNEVWLGQPQVYDLLSLAGEKIPDGWVAIARSRNLLLVNFACSFRPAPSCDFVKASVRVLLRSEPSTEKPIALDIFPKEVYIPTTYRRDLKIAPSISIGVDKVASAEASLFEIGTTQEYVRYDPEITAFGSGEAEFGWDFNKTRARPIKGIKDLFVIIQTSGDRLTVCFDVGAEIQTRLGFIRLPKFLELNDGSPLISKEFDLMYVAR